jgi:hypothetical protein
MQWKALSDDEKVEFHCAATADKQRYATELASGLASVAGGGGGGGVTDGPAAAAAHGRGRGAPGNAPAVAVRARAPAPSRLSEAMRE